MQVRHGTRFTGAFEEGGIRRYTVEHSQGKEGVPLVGVGGVEEEATLATMGRGEGFDDYDYRRQQRE